MLQYAPEEKLGSWEQQQGRPRWIWTSDTQPKAWLNSPVFQAQQNSSRSYWALIQLGAHFTRLGPELKGPGQGKLDVQRPPRDVDL